MKKILICGDSFAADWTVKYPGMGWPNLLAEKYDVMNLAQAGCGEYKIYQQLSSVDLSLFDYIIVFHTSPTRLHTPFHPIHHSDPLHHSSDFIYTDVKDYSKMNAELAPVVKYFENFFDLEHATFMHGLVCARIEQLLLPYRVIHATGILWDNLYQFKNMVDYSKFAKPNVGNLNHYDPRTNVFVYEDLISRLKHT